MMFDVEFLAAWTLLEQVIHRPRQEHNAQSSVYAEHGGMADYLLKYNPYEAQWTVKVSFSDGTVFEDMGFTPAKAIWGLIDTIKVIPFKGG